MKTVTDNHVAIVNYALAAYSHVMFPLNRVPGSVFTFSQLAERIEGVYDMRFERHRIIVDTLLHYPENIVKIL